MEPIYRKDFLVSDAYVDRFGKLKTSMLLLLAQEMATSHCSLLALDWDSMAKQGLFWAVIRQRVQITRMPVIGQTITLETWPMPTTRVAYPRSTIAYDAQGNELFRTISLWVLMDINSRAMVLPGKSGVTVNGTLRGMELAVPGSLAPKLLCNHSVRTVAFTDLDRNGHMNNTRYMDWIDDLLTSQFHAHHTPREFTVCYLSEAKESDAMDITWQLSEEGILQVDFHREKTDDHDKKDRIFSAQVLY